MTGCNTINQDSEKESQVVNTMGNDPGNIRNGGYASSQGDYIYYCSGGKDEAALYRAKTNGSNLEKLDDANARSINVLGDYVYYTNYDDYNKLYKTNIKEKTTEVIYPYAISDLHVINDIIYAVSQENDQSWKAVKMDLNGKNVETIFNDVMGITLSGNYLLIDLVSGDNNEDGMVIYNRLDHSYHILSDEKWDYIYAEDTLIYKDKIYFIDGNNNTSLLKRCNIDGTDEEILSNYSILAFHIIKNKLYYNYDDSLYKMNLDGTDVKLLVENYGSDNFNIINDKYVFYPKQTEDVEIIPMIYSDDIKIHPYQDLFRMNLDGSNNKPVGVITSKKAKE